VISPAACSEPQHLAENLLPDRLYVTDGGYFQYELFSRILEAKSSFVGRVNSQMAYHHRWTIEIFFRWMKSVLKARHLISHSANGVALQMYAALIVSLLIVLYTHRKPNRRMFETIQFYLLGWVSDEELEAELARLPKIDQ
jgi:hypothetical protein